MKTKHTTGVALAGLFKRNLAQHTSVLLEETIQSLKSTQILKLQNPVFVDATFGRGGHSRKLLEEFQNGRVISIDCDESAHSSDEYKQLVSEYGSRFQLVHGWFGDLYKLVTDCNVSSVNGIIFDLGVSSPQLDNPERGFSFKQDGPLSMAMSHSCIQSFPSQRSSTKFINSASTIINNFPEKKIADILWRLGEERHSRLLAKKIVMARNKQKITTTAQLSHIIRSTIQKFSNPKISTLDPSTRSFQALRMYVNREIPQLRLALAQAEGLLSPGGRLAVISFHSLEDREVKSFMQYCCGKKKGYEYASLPGLPDIKEELEKKASFSLIQGPIEPSEEEVINNARSRSAKLRFAERSKNSALVFPHIYDRQCSSFFFPDDPFPENQ